MSSPDSARIREIQRILSCTKFDFVSILSLPLSFTEDDIKSQYKSLSVLVHPDKAPPAFQERAKVAFTLLNAAKEALDGPDKVKEWQLIVKRAEEEVQKEKIAYYTQLRQQELAQRSGSGAGGIAANNAIATMTVSELVSLEQYPQWVRARVKDTLVADDYKKMLVLRRQNEAVQQALRDEEAKKAREERMAAMQAGRDLSLLGKSEAELEGDRVLGQQRADNWQAFQNKKSAGRYARSRFQPPTNKPPTTPSGSQMVSLGSPSVAPPLLPPSQAVPPPTALVPPPPPPTSLVPPPPPPIPMMPALPRNDRR